MRRLPRPFWLTSREFAFQITTIIAGILIALWVDGIVEARRERALVRDAHAALGREIADNLRASELEAFRASALDALGAVTVHKSLATQLAEIYRKAPKR